jgi:hypothetical protein
MPIFDIICLAASNKRRGLCVAGLRTDGGGWIRPWARTEYGELYPVHYSLGPGGAPRVLDVIRIPFVGPRPEVHHPENWLIADEPWQLIHRGLPDQLVPLVAASISSDPALLGNNPAAIAFSRFEERPSQASLALIEPANLHWVVEETRYNPRKPRAQFQLDCRDYSLPVTDPVYIPEFRNLAPGSHPVNHIGIDPAARVLLSISLSEPFDDDYCYKLVTAILPFAPGVLPTPEVPMDREEAAWIIDALARGTDPYSGDLLPLDGPLANPDTMKALRTALTALGGGEDRSSRLPRKLPENAGKPWSSQEDERLSAAYDAGQRLKALTAAHGRTRGAIKARLIRLGKIVA